MDTDTRDLRKTLKRVWHFIWYDDSVWSWLVNLILAFVIVKFIVYPLLGLLFGTAYPVVAVISGSMEHNGISFDDWWAEQSEFYEGVGITREDFRDYKFRNGFNKGDLMVVFGPNELKQGDTIVFWGNSPEPIIHRIIIADDGKYTTKGDNCETNKKSRSDEIGILDERIVGKAVFRIPYLGWVKVLFMKLVSLVL